MPDPAIFAETGDAFEQGMAAMEANGSWLVPDARGGRARLRHRAAAQRARPAGYLGQPDRRRRVQEHRSARTRPGSS